MSIVPVVGLLILLLINYLFCCLMMGDFVAASNLNLVSEMIGTVKASSTTGTSIVKSMRPPCITVQTSSPYESGLSVTSLASHAGFRTVELDNVELHTAHTSGSPQANQFP